MKVCKKCGATKALDQFYKHKLTSDGHTSACKTCVNIANAVWMEANPSRAKAIKSAWEKRNPDKCAAKARRQYHKDPAKGSATSRRWQKANPEKVSAWIENNTDKVRAARARSKQKHRAAHTARENARRAAKLHATPPWANQFFIEEAYELAALRTKVLGFEWQVDHIFPLRHPLFCGLHVDYNLQVIPAVENERKGNRVPPELLGASIVI